MANDPLAITSISRVQKVPDALHRDDAERQRRRRNALRDARSDSAESPDASPPDQPSEDGVATGNHGKLHVTA